MVILIVDHPLESYNLFLPYFGENVKSKRCSVITNRSPVLYFYNKALKILYSKCKKKVSNAS